MKSLTLLITLAFKEASCQDPPKQPAVKLENQVVCPPLICNASATAIFTDKNANNCFLMSTDTAGAPIYARECFDEKTQKVKEDFKYCEFNI